MNPASSRKSGEEAPPGGLVTRVAYGTARHLGSATRSACDGVWGVGRLIRAGHGALVQCARAVGRHILGGEPRPGKDGALLPREDVRSIIIEELTRLQAATDGITLLELEKRLRCMAETVEALQKRINELSVRGPVSEADVWKEMNALDAAEALTNEERTLLVSVFRRNIALQKPELAGASGDKEWRPTRLIESGGKP